jgi:hypothetical protein
MLSRSGEILRLNGSLFRRIVSSSNPDDLEILGCEFALDFIPHSLEILQLERNLSSFESFLSEPLGGWGWFQMEIIPNDEYHILRLVHNHGGRWSVFLKSFLTIALEKMLPSQTGHTDLLVSGEEIKMCFPKQSLSMQKLASTARYLP